MMPSQPPEVAQEIEAAVRAVLANHGIAGAVIVRGTQLELHGSGAPISIGLEQLVEQWGILPAEMRQRKITEVARRLAEAQRLAGGGGAAAASGASPIAWIAIPVVLVVLGLGGVLAWRKLGPGSAAPSASAAASAAPGETEEEGGARRARVCEATRRRVYSGASIGPFDTEGWYAEIWLAQKGDTDLTKSPAITAMVSGGKLAPGADATLGALPDGTVEIADGFTAQEAARAKGWRSVTLRFGGRYASAFLDPEARPRFLALADRLAETIPADVGAMYGRCVHLAYHDLGAWFRGTDAAGAAAAIVYGVGSHAELAAVDKTALAKLDPASDLDGLRGAAAKLDPLALGALVGTAGGSVTAPPGKGVTITFPLGGGTRAISASRTVARKLGVGVGAD